MADSEVEDCLNDDEKLRIVQSFLLLAPPGQLSNCLNDCRVLVNDDDLLKKACVKAIPQYNQEHMTPVKIENSEYSAMISDHNFLSDDRYLDPRTQQSFKYDHLLRQVSELKPVQMNNACETWRKSFEDTFTNYVYDHFRSPTIAVFGNIDENSNIKINICIQESNFQSKNFFTGSLRAMYTVTISDKVDIEGVIKLQIHYYENGNVMLMNKKNFDKKVLELKSEVETAEAAMALVRDYEDEYEVAVLDNYSEMSDVTFKALRRSLPVTRSKIDWQKVLTLKKLGTELRHH